MSWNKGNNRNNMHGAIITKCVTVSSGFRYEVDENNDLLGYYAANSGNFLPIFRDKLLSHL
jgi:hypothetical protein